MGKLCIMKKKKISYLSITTIIILMFCISQVNEVIAITFSFEEPTRFQNEEWSVIIEKSTTGVTKSLKFIPNSTDIIAHGFTGGFVDEDCYISRMTEDGAVLWISSINTTNEDL